MMTRLLVLGLCSLLLLAPVAGHAADYRFVDRGDTYYLDHLFENQLVVVLGKENGWVKVRYLNGAVESGQRAAAGIGDRRPGDGAGCIGIVTAVNQHHEGLSGGKIIVAIGGIRICRDIFVDTATVHFINKV